jgi:hypothetical protein
MTASIFNAKLILAQHTIFLQGFVMKKLIMLSMFILSSSLFAAEAKLLTFNKLILKKSAVSDIGVHYVTNRSIETWCLGSGSSMSLGNFEAAQTIEALADGLYSCEGKFVQVPGERTSSIQVFEIGSCIATNAVELKAECPTPAPKK